LVQMLIASKLWCMFYSIIFRERKAAATGIGPVIRAG